MFMAKIHGAVYIVVGLFVSVLSRLMNYQKLIFFFYLGLVFVGVGAVKLILKSKATETTDVKLQSQAHTAGHHPQLHNTQNFHHKRCGKCGSIMRISDRYCSRCGFMS